MGKNIPLGINIISILVLISGILSVLVGGFGIVGFLGLTGAGLGTIGVLALILGIIFLAIGIFKIILFFSLRKGRQWARAVVIILESISLISGVVALFTSFSIMTTISIVISGIIIWYLIFTKTAKRFFS